MVNVYLIGHGFVWTKRTVTLIAPMRAYVDAGYLLDGFGLASLIDNGTYQWQGHARRVPVAPAHPPVAGKWGDPLAQKPSVEPLPPPEPDVVSGADESPPPPPEVPPDLVKVPDVANVHGGGGRFLDMIKGHQPLNVAAQAQAQEALVAIQDPRYKLTEYAKGAVIDEHLLVTDEAVETTNDLGQEGTKGEGDHHGVCQKYVRAKANLLQHPAVVFQNNFGTLLRIPRLPTEPQDAPEETCIYQTNKKILTRLTDIQREVCLVFPEQHRAGQIMLHWAACRDIQREGRTLAQVVADIRRQHAIGVDGYATYISDRVNFFGRT